MSVKKIPKSGKNIPSEAEAEATLSKEGYDCFIWTDVPGVVYEEHVHEIDECLWVIRGQIIFKIDEQDITLDAGDRLYLPARTKHSAKVPRNGAVTYLIGQKRRS